MQVIVRLVFLSRLRSLPPFSFLILEYYPAAGRIGGCAPKPR